MRRYWLVFLLLFCGAGIVRAEDFYGKGIFSFDFGYMKEALRHDGWGLGVAYERELASFCSVKGTFSHVSLRPSDGHGWVTTVGLGVDARVYPFARGLQWLYLGCGWESDFLMRTDGDDGHDLYLSYCPHLGWKQDFFGYVMLDAYLGYRVRLSAADDFLFESGAIRQGFEYGVSAQVNLSKIWKRLRGR